jgi:hypothetical protein
LVDVDVMGTDENVFGHVHSSVAATSEAARLRATGCGRFSAMAVAGWAARTFSSDIARRDGVPGEGPE